MAASVASDLDALYAGLANPERYKDGEGGGDAAPTGETVAAPVNMDSLFGEGNADDDGDDDGDDDEEDGGGDDDEEEEEEDDGEEDDAYFQPNAAQRESDEKNELLISLERLQHQLPVGERIREMDANDTIEDIRYECFRVQRIVSNERGARLLHKLLVTACTGLEMMVERFNPLGLRLEGLSSAVLQDFNSYQESLTGIARKYTGRSSMPPELSLLITLGSTIVFTHVSNVNNQLKRPPVTSKDTAADIPELPKPSRSLRL